VRVLLDEQLPRQLLPHIIGHEARTVQQHGWAGLKNGDLLRNAKVAGFEIFITSDQNLEFQQNLKNSGLFVVILAAPSNALEDLLPLVPAVLVGDGEPESWSGRSSGNLKPRL
jgi:hypothetical protein